MLIIRPTKSFANKLGVTLDESPDLRSPSFLGEWYANDFRLGRSEFILFVNVETRLSVVIKAAPYKTAPDRFVAELQQVLRRLGFGGTLESLGVDVHASVQFAKTSNRSVLGNLTRFIEDLAWESHLGRPTVEEPMAMSLRLCDALAGINGRFHVPVELLRSRIGAPIVRGRSHLRLVT